MGLSLGFMIAFFKFNFIYIYIYVLAACGLFLVPVSEMIFSLQYTSSRVQAWWLLHMGSVTLRYVGSSHTGN